MKRYLLTCLLFLGLSGLPAVAATEVLLLAQAKSADDAAREAKDRYGGKVLSVELDGSGDSAVYLVKLLAEGQVRVVTIAAN